VNGGGLQYVFGEGMYMELEGSGGYKTTPMTTHDHP
jgi:hypothetical protein